MIQETQRTSQFLPSKIPLFCTGYYFDNFVTIAIMVITNILMLLVVYFPITLNDCKSGVDTICRYFFDIMGSGT